MNKFVNVGNQVLVNTNDIMCICPISALPSNKLAEAIDLSGGSKRAAVLTSNGNCLLVDIRFSTLKTRMNALKAES